MNKVNKPVFRAIIFTVVSIVITIVSWLVISLSRTQNSWFYFCPIFGAIISLIFSIIVIFQETHERKQNEITITKAPIKINFEIDEAHVSLEAPDIESAAKLLECLRVNRSESTTREIYDIPEFP